MVLPTTLSIINATFRGRERGIAFAVWGSTIGGMVAVGPLLGGWLTTAFSWRWAFGINVPLGIIIFIGVLLTVTESREARYGKIDFLGRRAVGAHLRAPRLRADRGPHVRVVAHRHPDGDRRLHLAVRDLPRADRVRDSALALVSFIAWERHRKRIGSSVLLEFSLMRIASFRNGNIAAMVVSLGEFGIILTLPLWLQFVLGFDALQTGFLLLSLAIGSFVASGFAGATSDRISPVTIVRVGLVAEIIGVAGIGVIIGPEAVLGLAHPRPLHLRLRRGTRHRPADRRDPAGCARGDVRPGFGHAVHRPARSVQRSASRSSAPSCSRARPRSSLRSSRTGASRRPGRPGRQRGGRLRRRRDPRARGQPATAEIADAAKSAFSAGTRLSAFAAAGFLVVGLAATFSLGSGRTARGRASMRRSRIYLARIMN